MNSVCGSVGLKNILCLKTLYLGIPQNIFKLTPETAFPIKTEKIGFLKEEFAFSIMKMIGSQISIICRRIPIDGEKRDDGYFIRFQFSIHGLDEEAKTADMPYNADLTFVNFPISAAYRIITELKTEDYFYDLKVVVRIAELTNIENSVRESMLDIITHAKNTLKPTTIKNLNFILKRPDFSDIFTGRLPVEYNTSIMSMIMRLATISNMVAAYLGASSEDTKHKDKLLEEFDLSRVLNVILCGKTEPISKLGAIRAYKAAHKLGMDFFAELCTDYIVSILNDKAIILDVLEAAVTFEDDYLFREATLVFLKYFSEIVSSDQFQMLSDRARWMARSVIHSVRVYLSKRELYIPEWNVTAQQSTEL